MTAWYFRLLRGTAPGTGVAAHGEGRYLWRYAGLCHHPRLCVCDTQRYVIMASKNKSINHGNKQWNSTNENNYIIEFQQPMVTEVGRCDSIVISFIGLNPQVLLG